MITGQIKSQVDDLWRLVYSNGISNPLTVIEQLSYLLFAKRLDDVHTARELRANVTGEPLAEPVFGPDEQGLRWSRFRQLPPREMFETVRDGVFPFIQTMGAEGGTYARHMEGAQFLIPTPSLLAGVVERVETLPLEDRDTKGDLYEYMLGKLATAGQAGQFRTPRHVIAALVEMAAPTPADTILDPACGTAGFLVGAAEYLRERHTDLFADEATRRHFHEDAFTGWDFDATMLRIGSMNLMLHGIEDPAVERHDALSDEVGGVRDRFSLVLANPPFAGTIDAANLALDVAASPKSKKSEVLFLRLILRLLEPGGRAAVIVPDGALFGSTGAHRALRKALVEDHRLEAVVSLPSGVFRPYAGVSTGALVFTKTGRGGTDKVWFYDVRADGFSLDDKRQPVEADDLPDLLARWADRGAEADRERTDQSFFVPRQEIVENGYDLSFNRYREREHHAVEHDDPRDILADLRRLEAEIADDLDALEALVA